jgi:hypothetical protein
MDIAERKAAALVADIARWGRAFVDAYDKVNYTGGHAGVAMVEVITRKAEEFTAPEERENG